MPPLIQVLATALMLAYAGYWRRRQSKRRSESWNEIVAKLRPNDWGYESVARRYLYSDQIDATPEDIWPRISGAKGLWAMYVNASVLVQLADYASEHGDETRVPEELLEGIRSDAFHLRMSVLMALAQHVLSKSSVAAKVSAHRATAAYAAMLARTTTAFQEHSAMLFPKFLDAM
jgi:organic hydroperoxide reductase OsmC/OhrA